MKKESIKCRDPAAREQEEEGSESEQKASVPRKRCRAKI